MRLEFDASKSERNAKDRGLPFDRVADFDWHGAMSYEDTRRDYPERRFVAVGHIGIRLHVVCFTPIDGGIRVISLRKANAREVKRHEQEAADR